MWTSERSPAYSAYFSGSNGVLGVLWLYTCHLYSDSSRAEFSVSRNNARKCGSRDGAGAAGHFQAAWAL